ncbi:MAG: hypothetical protein VST68_07625 [Nitrospirota bacterium]|nr:hypothetical protein [Nitrospirota bacterium]
MRIGLVAEVKWEVREVCRQLNMTLVDPDDEIWGATLNGHDVRLCLSGMIPSIAKERVTRFLDNHSPEIMISCGLAGALSSNVLVGDLIVQSLDSSLSTHAEQSLSKKGISFHVGPLVTVSKPVLTPEARREVAANSQAIGVDMESQTIAKLCQQRGIRCMAIKGVSDGIEDDLSPILGGFEIVHIPKIAKHVLFSPSTWGLASRMARQSYSAATNLGHGVWATLQGVH